MTGKTLKRGRKKSADSSKSLSSGSSTGSMIRTDRVTLEMKEAVRARKRSARSRNLSKEVIEEAGKNN